MYPPSRIALPCQRRHLRSEYRDLAELDLITQVGENALRFLIHHPPPAAVSILGILAAHSAAPRRGDPYSWRSSGPAFARNAAAVPA